MSSRKKQISSELEEQLRSVSFSPATEPTRVEEEQDKTADEETSVEAGNRATSKAFSFNKRVVTLEYLNKLEQATKASARYDSIKEFSQMISNLSLILLSVSIITYLVFYFINPQTVSLISLLLLSLEAFALLGLTLYSMYKASHYKQLRDIAMSDFSTCSQAIGNPMADSYIPLDH